ncbi:unnamed protein product [Thelazia callipaeda]|uniref:Uncharacterized protein n=1 Tax=Thelazia callipaeda TaxID=103827 RepID=A0A0N5D7C4_THECL|nr:unnamed protein product [Thelazia callipaeda]
MQMEQRLCDLKTRFCSIKQNTVPLSESSQLFLKSYYPHIMIHTINGFQIHKKRGGQTAYDIRHLILTSQNQNIIPFDWEILQQIQPFLSVIEFQVFSHIFNIITCIL